MSVNIFLYNLSTSLSRSQPLSIPRHTPQTSFRTDRVDLSIANASLPKICSLRVSHTYILITYNNFSHFYQWKPIRSSRHSMCWLFSWCARAGPVPWSRGGRGVSGTMRRCCRYCAGTLGRHSYNTGTGQCIESGSPSGWRRRHQWRWLFNGAVFLTVRVSVRGCTAGARVTGACG